MKKFLYIVAYALIFAAVCSVGRDIAGEVHIVAWVVGNVVTATFVWSIMVSIFELVEEGL